MALPWVILASVAGQAAAADLRTHQRLLIVAAPSASDPDLIAETKILAAWRDGAAERDLSIIRVVDVGADSATGELAKLRGRYGLSPRIFAVVLIGKDGHVAKRSSKVLTAADLEAVIDAMPMRRAGER